MSAFLTVAIVLLVVLVVAVGALVATRSVASRAGRRADAPPTRPPVEPTPPTVSPTVAGPTDELVEEPIQNGVAGPEVEVPLPSAGRLQRLRGRLSRSQSSLGQGLLALLVAATGSTSRRGRRSRRRC